MKSKISDKQIPTARGVTLGHISQTWLSIKHQMHVRIMERVKEEGAASLSQCSVLGSVCTQTGVTVKKIAAYLGVTSPAATQIVHELERQELIKKVPNPADSRSAFLTPTPAGKKLLSKTEKIFSTEFEKIL
jgi:DNA-binding MarR family transcriptional regulator